MLKLAILDRRQSLGTLNVMKEAVPSFKCLAVDLEIGEAGFGVLLLQFWAGERLFVDPLCTVSGIPTGELA